MSDKPLDMSGKVVNLSTRRPVAAAPPQPPAPDPIAFDPVELLEKVIKRVKDGDIKPECLLVIVSQDNGFDTQVFYAEPAADRHKLIGMAADAATYLALREVL